ncbi:TlpA disulfide reductase family protein [Brevundimonas sp.]|uniref:TlpA family protein disulfide reductase n=1 Tax=Brevundimonas sp. TaxID=1871086 RepID=UPI0017D2582F|nr:TlpA disulfide reductase family protein [Brevundimonas sp.]MBA4808402.1 TlpA family protein disulfide reductase [Brevundimonas sp.]
MSGSRKAIWAVVGALVLISTLAGAGGLAMSLYANHARETQAPKTTAAESDLARFAVGPLASLETPTELKTAPEYMFRDRNGTAVRFSTFEGKVVVVNLWAMWCAPCRTEMPTLAKLARSYQRNEDLIVLPINVDASADALADAKSFIDVHEPLPLYSDIKFQLPFEFPGKGKMPQTIFLDREGRIRATFSGEADWDSPQAHALIDALLAEGAPAPGTAPAA